MQSFELSLQGGLLALPDGKACIRLRLTGEH